MKILIAGAGIGGLSAALCLLKSGHEVEVFEQAPQFFEVGAGIQCGANALRVLDYLDLVSQLESVSVAPKKIDFRDHKTGEALYSIPLGERYRQRYGAPYLHVHRADLHTILADAFNAYAVARLRFNAAVQSYVETPSHVTLRLADGRSFTGDCLIGADGINSAVRRHIIGDSKPVFTGNVAWRGVVDVDRLPSDWMDLITSNFVGARQHAVVYYLRDKKLANLVAVVENQNWTSASWVQSAPWSELKADFAGWHPVIQSIIEALDKDQCYRWALYDHKPQANWSSQRATLLGDAAHATLPFMASGAAMAIEDGRILQRALDTITSGRSTSVSAALKLYQRNRIERTAKIQRSSAMMGKLYHIENRLLLRSVFQALRLLGGRAEAFLPEYDANTVELS